MKRRRKWTEEHLREAVRASTSIRQIIGKLGLQQAGGNYEQIKRYIKEYDLNVSHLKGKAWNKGLHGIGKPLVPTKHLLVRNSTFQSYKLKKRLFKEGLKPEHCEECEWSEKTEDGYLPLELDHVNGDRNDNRLKNLRILCPNCHSLKPTHRGRNIGKTKRRGGGIGRHATLKML